MNNDNTCEKLLAELFPSFTGRFVVLTNWGPIYWSKFKHEEPTYWFKFRYEEPGSTWIYFSNHDAVHHYYKHEPCRGGDVELAKEDVLEILKWDKLKHKLEVL